MKRSFFWIILLCNVTTVLWGQVPVQTSAARDVRSQVVNQACLYLGAPYRYGGTEANVFDCSGLVFRVYKDVLGISVPRTVQELYGWVQPISFSSAQEGDLLFFNTTGTISHVAIYLGNERFIHSVSDGPSPGVQINSLGDSYWRRTFVGAGRVVSPAEFHGWILNAGLASDWKIANYGNTVRGLTCMASISKSFFVLQRNWSPALELRFEWDDTLGIMRLPVTVSLDITKEVRIFAGPAFSFGTAQLQTSQGKRTYTPEGFPLGELGIQWTPISLRTGPGTLKVGGELAWQSYTRSSELPFEWSADLAANLRLSTGIWYSWDW